MNTSPSPVRSSVVSSQPYHKKSSQNVIFPKLYRPSGPLSKTRSFGATPLHTYASYHKLSITALTADAILLVTQTSSTHTVLSSLVFSGKLDMDYNFKGWSGRRLRKRLDKRFSWVKAYCIGSFIGSIGTAFFGLLVGWFLSSLIG